MDRGVIQQCQNFRRDYADGEAMVREYLQLLNSPTYLTAGNQKKPETIAVKSCSRSSPNKYEEAFKIFPGCQDMTKRCISYKMSRLGYYWEKAAKQWRQKT